MRCVTTSDLNNTVDDFSAEFLNYFVSSLFQVFKIVSHQAGYSLKSCSAFQYVVIPPFRPALHGSNRKFDFSR